MPKIFISYRRDDSQDIASRINEHLTRAFGSRSVFFDVAGSIPAGVDWRDELHKALSESDVLLVVIGPDWERIMQERVGTDDWVRFEIETGLNNNLRVIPVMVKNAEVPSQLPPSIQELTAKQTIDVLEDPYFDDSVRYLIRQISPWAFVPIVPIATVITLVLIVIVLAFVDILPGPDIFPDSPLDTPVNSEENSSNSISPTSIYDALTNAERIELDNGLAYVSEKWSVFITRPVQTRDPELYTNGVDVLVAEAIDNTSSTLDIAAFELNNPVITQAILNAHDRDVQVRIVTDDEHGLEDSDSTLPQLQAAGIPIVDDGRTSLMHDTFMVLDGEMVFSGSMNYTVNDVYRNNNNVLALRLPSAVTAFQQEFDEMFVNREFGPRSNADNGGSFFDSGIRYEVHFASEGDAIGQILSELEAANSSIHVMAFSFTRDDMGQIVMAKARNGLDVEVIFETTGSQTEFSELTNLACSGVRIYQDGNPFILHHKVIVIDDETAITGSFNFSENAIASNDENVILIHNAAIAAIYLEEFERQRSIAGVPDGIVCD